MVAHPVWGLRLQTDRVGVHGGRSPAENADPRLDPRVAAVSAAVPVSAMFTPESLARVAVPVVLVRAARDQWLLPAFHIDHVLRLCLACSLLVNLEGAAHMDLLGPWPESAARAVGAQQPRGGNTEPGFDPLARAAAFQAVADFFVLQLGR